MLSSELLILTTNLRCCAKSWRPVLFRSRACSQRRIEFKYL